MRNAVLETIENRRSVRLFCDRDISESDIMAVLQAGFISTSGSRSLVSLIPLAALLAWPPIHIMLMIRGIHPVGVILRAAASRFGNPKWMRFIIAAERMAGKFCQQTPRALLTAVVVSLAAGAGTEKEPAATETHRVPQAEISTQTSPDSPEFFMRNANRYDAYDRKKSAKIYVGEYAVTQGCGKGNLRAAVGEAAFMTGLERNSDHVIMASYAPLLVNLNHRAWNPDLINFDSSRWYGVGSTLDIGSRQKICQ